MPKARGRHSPAKAQRLLRRAMLALIVAACLSALAAPAAAGSYMDRAWLLIAEGSRANEFLGKRLYDRELARVVGQAAEGRLQAAKVTQVPREVELAHPHLLLMLEHYERAAAAAALGELPRYFEHSRAAQDEEQLFRSILRQLGWTLPSGKS